MRSTPRKNYREFSEEEDQEIDNEEDMKDDDYGNDIEIIITPKPRANKRSKKEPLERVTGDGEERVANSINPSSATYPSSDPQFFEGIEMTPHASSGAVNGSIFEQVMMGLNPNAIISEWFNLVKKAPQGAILEILNLLIDASGIQDQSITPSDMEKYEAEPDAIINAIQKRIKKVKPMPLFNGKVREQKQQRKLFSRFWMSWAEGLALQDQEEIIQASLIWILSMTSATFRLLRHAATCASLDVVLGLSKALDSKKKKSHNSNLLPCQEIVEKHCQLMIDTVFIQRFRDVDPQIRIECLDALVRWIHDHPDTFLDNSYIRYLGWALSDKNPSVRDKASQSLNILLRECQKTNRISNLTAFTDRFKSRICEMASRDLDPSVRKNAAILLSMAHEVNLIRSDDLNFIDLMIREHYPFTREHVRLLSLRSGMNWESILRYSHSFQQDQIDYLMELLKDNLDNPKYLVQLLLSDSSSFNSIPNQEINENASNFKRVELSKQECQTGLKLLVSHVSMINSDLLTRDDLLLLMERYRGEHAEQVLKLLFYTRTKYSIFANQIKEILVNHCSERTITILCLDTLKQLMMESDQINEGNGEEIISFDDLDLVSFIDHLPTSMKSLDWNQLSTLYLNLELVQGICSIKNLGWIPIEALREIFEFLTSLFAIKLPVEQLEILDNYHKTLLGIFYQNLLWAYLENDNIKVIDQRDFLYGTIQLQLQEESISFDRRERLVSLFVDLAIIFNRNGKREKIPQNWYLLITDLDKKLLIDNMIFLANTNRTIVSIASKAVLFNVLTCDIMAFLLNPWDQYSQDAWQLLSSHLEISELLSLACKIPWKDNGKSIVTLIKNTKEARGDLLLKFMIEYPNGEHLTALTSLIANPKEIDQISHAVTNVVLKKALDRRMEKIGHDYQKSINANDNLVNNNNVNPTAIISDSNYNLQNEHNNHNQTNGINLINQEIEIENNDPSQRSIHNKNVPIKDNQDENIESSNENNIMIENDIIDNVNYQNNEKIVSNNDNHYLTFENEIKNGENIPMMDINIMDDKDLPSSPIKYVRKKVIRY